MEALVKASAFGKTKEASKSGKFHYLFVNGTKNDKGLFEKFSTVDFWSDVDKPVEAGKEYKLVLDINPGSEFVGFIRFAD